MVKGLLVAAFALLAAQAEAAPIPFSVEKVSYDLQGETLKGFLQRELDFYLKNEVLNVDDLEAGGEARAESWFQLVRVIKAIGRKIIAFIAQIEDF